MTSKFQSFGSSLHRTLAKFNRITDVKNKTYEVLIALLRACWISKGYSNLTEEKDFFKKGSNILKNYHNEPLDVSKKNLLIEKFIEKPLNDCISLCGVIDKCYITKEGYLEILDYKIGKKNCSKHDIYSNLQLYIYAVLCNEVIGFFPYSVSYYYLCSNQKYTEKLRMSHIRLTENFIKDIILKTSIEPSFPNNDTSHCWNCEFYQLCKEMNKFTSSY